MNPRSATHTCHVFGARVGTDGWLDVIVGNHKQANDLLLNGGTGVFSSDASFPGGTAATHALAWGDVDGGARSPFNGGPFVSPALSLSEFPGGHSVDGDLDLIVGNFGAPNELLLNSGSGGFSIDLNYAGGSATTAAVAFADLNGDGALDVFAGNAGGSFLFSELSCMPLSGLGQYTEDPLRCISFVLSEPSCVGSYFNHAAQHDGDCVCVTSDVDCTDTSNLVSNYRTNVHGLLGEPNQLQLSIVSGGYISNGGISSNSADTNALAAGDLNGEYADLGIENPGLAD